MKIIALVPVKNEAWVLPSYLSSVTKIADEVIALDDNSTDTSAGILDKAGAFVFKENFGNERVINMSQRRAALLEKGRMRGGTHFIWLDADETFSSNFIPKARAVIETMKPGEKLTMRWVHMWKNTTQYLNDTSSPFGYIWKDFIVCDDSNTTFTDQFLSEARTPGPYGTPLVLDEENGAVLHWQFARWEITQHKQALYRCRELVEGSRGARRINNTYSITLENKNLKTLPLPSAWTENIVTPEINSSDINQYLIEIQRLFTTHSVKFFEPLQIWHIPELQQLFINETGRVPKSKVFPAWLVTLNNIRHGITKN